jgi:phenylacetate-coenzyme A ligase PaaK-like adenylate-forming protein
LWQGEWLDELELRSAVKNLSSVLEAGLQVRLETSHLLSACDLLSQELRDKKGKIYALLSRSLAEDFGMESLDISNSFQEISEFMKREKLEQKLERELGTNNPFDFSRPDRRLPIFEKWAPLGFLVHTAPTNSFSVGALSVVEGLLAGNVNFLKTGGSDGLFAQFFLKFLGDLDESGTISSKVFACRISSREQDLLKEILSYADGIAAWGGEEGIEGIRALAPSSVRFIDWGPKISFAYFALESLENKEEIGRLARDCCLLDQEACSSPQCVYVETSNQEVLKRFAHQFAAELEKVSPTIPAKIPSLQEQAEITSVTELCRLESCLGLTEVIETPDKSWRILIDHASALRASPLFRTIWVKPIKRNKILESLRPFRFYLQTVGLSCGLESLAEISEALVSSGVLRITPVGQMLDSYPGEPHDGVYALQRYARRTSLQSDQKTDGISTFSELTSVSHQPPKVKVMSKAEFQAAAVEPQYAHLYFKSGGSSGDPKLSIFSYEEYHLQMAAGADGLFAAGLDPIKDRCMNLLYAGGLYGGFVSIFSVLENLKAVQFPMGAHPDTKMVAEMIAAHQVNTLLGMPSYLIQLFGQNEVFLKKHPVVEKIFYGGEHFSEVKRKYFKKTFGVKWIRSAAYGSVDAGPIGFQCSYCEGSVHHLFSSFQIMEILDLEKDMPAPLGEPGRVVLTSLARAGQKLERYEIGDMARFLPGACPCGRKTPRFELLGRHGDVFRIGSMFFNYAKFERILEEEFQYTGELQILLQSGERAGKEKLRLCISRESGLEEKAVRSAILEGYSDLKEVVVEEKILDLEISIQPAASFPRVPGSGKLRRIVDER